MREGIMWIVITTNGEKTFTTTEYMTKFVMENENIVISITHI